MTIDKEQLISLLEKKTGSDREQVEAQLSELINRIQKAADEGKTFEVEGFGTFNMEEGRLQFEPGDTLETEINNKYAGMKPIELIGAFKEPETDEEVPEVDMTEAESAGLNEDKWAFDNEATDDQKEEEQQVEERQSEPVTEPEKVGKESIVPGGSETEDQQEAEEVFDTVFGTGDADSEDSKQEESSDPDEVTGEEKEARDTIGTVLVAVVVILVIGIGGWLIYDISISGTSGTDVSRTTSQSTQQVDPLGANTQSEEQSGQDEGAVESEQSSAVSTEEEDAVSRPTAEQNRYGLYGEPNQTISNGYTIVVHSLRDQQIAEQNRQQLQNAGFRALISQAQVQGETYYRVGLGQFKNVSEAQQAIGDIPKRYRDNNFIKRIQ